VTHDYLTAYDDEQLEDILDSNDSAPSIDSEQFERIMELARMRARGRGDSMDDGLERDEYECLICTDWDSFAGNEFGYDGDVNQFALGIYDHDVSASKGASLFTDVSVIQHGWLSTGDGRKTQFERYEDDDYEQAEPGEMWIPNGAQDYICIVVLDPELLYEDPGAAEAM
jgi:hypothetical protein